MDVSGETVRSITSWMSQNYVIISVPGIICGLTGILWGWRTRNWLFVLSGVGILGATVINIIGSYCLMQKQY